MIHGYLLMSMLVVAQASKGEVIVGSKSFTESAILGEMLSLLAEDAGYKVTHRENLGGTGLVWNSLRVGDIDIYPDYTGTIAKTILKHESLRAEKAIRDGLAELDVVMSASLGFENSYEIGMKSSTAKQHQINTISDLQDHPEFRFGFGTEFMDRQDGWPGLQKRYKLPQTRIRGLEHALGYRAVSGDVIQAKDVYGTDANINQFKIRVLDDNLDFFPEYSCVVLYRADLKERAPEFVKAVHRLEGKIDTDSMIEMNTMVDVKDATVHRVANNFLATQLKVGQVIPEPTQFESVVATVARILRSTLQHLLMVVISLALAIVVAVPLGVVAAKRPDLEHVILTSAEVIQTIPGLALLVMLIGPLGLIGLNTVGPIPAIIALFLYSLLPIIRNTFTGIHDIPNSMRESADALGLTPSARLWQIELPLASRLILAGIKTTAVINVGYATLGGLIGAGGYGEPILQGLYRNSTPKMLEGAIPAALLALAVKSLFEFSERFVVPKGLRLKATH